MSKYQTNELVFWEHRIRRVYTSPTHFLVLQSKEMPNRHHVRHVDNIPSISTLHIWEKVVPASGYEIYNSQTHREYILFISHKPYRFLLEIKRVFHNRRGLHEEQLYQIPHWLLEQGVEEEDINLMYPFPSNFNIFRAFWNQLTDSSPPYFSNHIIIWGGEKK